MQVLNSEFKLLVKFNVWFKAESLNLDHVLILWFKMSYGDVRRQNDIKNWAHYPNIFWPHCFLPCTFPGKWDHKQFLTFFFENVKINPMISFPLLLLWSSPAAPLVSHFVCCISKVWLYDWVLGLKARHKLKVLGLGVRKSGSD